MGQVELIKQPEQCYIFHVYLLIWSLKGEIQFGVSIFNYVILQLLDSKSMSNSVQEVEKLVMVGMKLT